MPDPKGSDRLDSASHDSALSSERQNGAEYRVELDHLFSVAYEELRRLASSVKTSAAPRSPLSPSTLVNEAWLKLEKASQVTPESKAHFKHLAARAMRLVLVEAARHRYAIKRGGKAQFVEFDDSLLVSTDQDLIALDDALKDLALLNPWQASLVEIRFFGGCSVDEAAAVLGASKRTIERDWRATRAWLASEIKRGR